MENKSRNGAPRKLTDRDTRGLVRLVKDNKRKSLNEITNVFNQVRTSSVSKRTVQRKLPYTGPVLCLDIRSETVFIIETLWYRHKHELKRLLRNLTSASELETAIRVFWNKTPVSYIKNLYSTIPRRLQSVIKSRGYISKY